MSHLKLTILAAILSACLFSGKLFAEPALDLRKTFVREALLVQLEEAQVDVEKRLYALGGERDVFSLFPKIFHSDFAHQDEKINLIKVYSQLMRPSTDADEKAIRLFLMEWLSGEFLKLSPSRTEALNWAKLLVHAPQTQREILEYVYSKANGAEELKIIWQGRSDMAQSLGAINEDDWLNYIEKITNLPGDSSVALELLPVLKKAEANGFLSANLFKVMLKRWTSLSGILTERQVKTLAILVSYLRNSTMDLPPSLQKERSKYALHGNVVLLLVLERQLSLKRKIEADTPLKLAKTNDELIAWIKQISDAPELQGYLIEHTLTKALTIEQFKKTIQTRIEIIPSMGELTRAEMLTYAECAIVALKPSEAASAIADLVDSAKGPAGHFGADYFDDMLKKWTSSPNLSEGHIKTLLGLTRLIHSFEKGSPSSSWRKIVNDSLVGLEVLIYLELEKNKDLKGRLSGNETIKTIVSRCSEAGEHTLLIARLKELRPCEVILDDLKKKLRQLLQK